MEYDLIYKVETGDFGNRCEVVEFKHCGSKIVIDDISIDRDYTSYIVSNVIFIGKNGGCDRYIPDKTRVLKQFKELAKEKDWKVKVIWDDEEHYFNLIIDEQKYSFYNVIEVLYDETNMEWVEKNKNINEEECKMGVKKEVEIIKVSLYDGKLIKKTVFDDTIVSYDAENREVITNSTHRDVIELRLDGMVVFEYPEPIIKAIDEREEYVEAKMEYDELNLRVELGLIPKTAEINGKLEELLTKVRELCVTVRYELDWDAGNE